MCKVNKEIVGNVRMTAASPREHFLFSSPDEEPLTLDQEHGMPDQEYVISGQKSKRVWSKIFRF